MADSIVPHSLDDYFQSTPIGSVDKAIVNNLYGINHRQIDGAVASNKDTYGLTFFVRPQLNLQNDNIRNSRLFTPLLTTNSNSIQRYVRATLDPRQVAGYKSPPRGKLPPITKNGIPCPVMDNENCFIPVLTNNLKSMSGWPDITAPTFNSKSGLYNEVYSQVDGITRVYESFDIDATFRNTRGDPILYMFYIWLHYSSLVFEGKLFPYLDYLIGNEIDYTSRIYRLVLDPQKDTVRKIAATGACFPISVPTGSFFDFNAEKPYNDQNRDITIRFKCLGAEYLDDILIKEFNDTVVIFNPSMSNSRRNTDMVKVNKNLIQMFNNRGYPRINPTNNQLEWWVSSQLFKTRTDQFLASNLTDLETINREEVGD
jgi:hypothetical protein